jgi:hypothetical protein
MNVDRTNQKDGFAPSQDETTLAHPKSSETKRGGKYLVDFLITRKRTQIASQKQTDGSGNRS